MPRALLERNNPPPPIFKRCGLESPFDDELKGLSGFSVAALRVAVACVQAVNM
jgi:hypothetical protein